MAILYHTPFQDYQINPKCVPDCNIIVMVAARPTTLSLGASRAGQEERTHIGEELLTSERIRGNRRYVYRQV